MTARVPSPVPVCEEIRVHPGPALLDDISLGPSLSTHRGRYGVLPRLRRHELQRLVESVGLRGRGGAAFPFAIKLAATAGGRRPVVVVNISEGEPASAKDTALALTRPHLVLDGATVAAHAIGARDVHVVLPGDRPLAAASMSRAIGERDDGVRMHRHAAAPRFVAGQARAVVELLSGRTNLPTTNWTPEAKRGLDGRPTLLSNAETWAHVALLALRGEAAYRRFGRPDEPGTTLLTLTARGMAPQVHEVAYGTRLRDVLPGPAVGGPALVGGFHGSWVSWHTLASVRVSVSGMKALGLPLGAGVVHVPGPGSCPMELTGRIVDYLADQSARRCGPCLNGLPSMAVALRELLGGVGGRARIDHLAGLVERRGACAHPDGTVRLVRSLFAMLPHEVEAHASGACAVRTQRWAS
jgi:NADH:ubiquinone oxidoreductase subunit F (NADH-binding)